MLDNIKDILFLLVICLGFYKFYKICGKILDTLIILYNNIEKLHQPDYKSMESAAEAALSEEEPEEESLYLNKDGKYSYLAYNENKKRREKEKNGEEYIDDFEKAAEELEKPERKSKYAR